MRRKPVIPRARAVRDVEEAIDFYLAEGAAKTSLGFVDALEQAYAHVSEHPASGSPRYGHELDLPGLRSWPLIGFPFLVFYLEYRDHIDVWRVLHGNRDIPVWMTAAD